MTNGPGARTNLPNGHEINGDFIKIREKFYRLGAPEAGRLSLTSLEAPIFSCELARIIFYCDVFSIEINILFSRKVENKITDPREIEIRPWTTGMINFAQFVNARQVVPSICQGFLI